MTGAAHLRVVVAEPPPDTQLHDAFSVDRAIEVAGSAPTGLEAVTLVRRLRPDAVVVDSRISRINGLDVTRRIMSETPTPIIMIADDTDAHGIRLSMEAQLAGALATARRPTRAGTAEFAERSSALVALVRTMAGLKLVRRWQDQPHSNAAVISAAPRLRTRAAVVAIGASTGGPAAIHQILSDVAPSFPVPLLITQHISPGFVAGMVRWLDEETALRVKIAEEGEPLRGGVVYVAGDQLHLTVARDHTVALTASEPVDGHRPSVTKLFCSVAEAFGPRALAVILTGMGTDGAKGLGAVRNAGGRVIAQDRETSAVFGMPQAAIVAGLADTVLPLEQIAGELMSAIAFQQERACTES